MINHMPVECVDYMVDDEEEKAFSWKYYNDT